MSTEEAAPAAGAQKKGGIFYGWWIVFTGLLAKFAYAEQFNTSYGVFVHVLGVEFGWARTVLAGVHSVSKIPEALLASVLGPLIDRYGARWFIAVGGLVVGASFIALSTIEALWQLYLYKGLLMPLGAVCLGGFIGVTVSNWFVIKRGRALGMIQVGGFLATGIMPLAAAVMIEFWGWRQAWLAMGVLVLVLTVPAAVVFRRRPEDVGMHPDGVAPGEEGPPRAETERQRRRRAALLAADVPWTRGAVLRTPVFWIAIFAWGLAGLAVTGTNLHIVPFVVDLGYPLVIGAAALGLRAATAMFTSTLWGLVAERISVKTTASVNFATMALAMLVFLVFPTPAGIVVGLLVYGIGIGGNFVTQEALWAEYYGRTSLGLVRGLGYPMQLALAAAGPVVLGLIYDLSGSYQIAWLVLCSGFGLAGVLVQFSRPPKQ